MGVARQVAQGRGWGLITWAHRLSATQERAGSSSGGQLSMCSLSVALLAIQIWSPAYWQTNAQVVLACSALLQDEQVVTKRQLSRNPSIQGVWNGSTFAAELKAENARRHRMKPVLQR
jgi:hypothetical protein